MAARRWLRSTALGYDLELHDVCLLVPLTGKSTQSGFLMHLVLFLPRTGTHGAPEAASGQ